MYVKSNTTRDLETSMKLMENAEYVLLHFTDLIGSLKGRTVPSQEAAKTLKEGLGFDGSSITGGVNIQESDMIMKPDASTFTVYPHYFYDRSVVGFICNINKPDGSSFKNDPRYICQRTVQKAVLEGYGPTAAAELEFYLVQKNEKNEIYPVENHLIDKHRYFDNTPGRDITQSYRLDLSNALSSMGIMVEREQHEVGAAQNEITFKYSDPVTTADNIMLYKFATKSVAAKKYDWIATFMPKPWSDRPGNGMHIHLGLANPKTKENLFYSEEGYAQLSQECLYFIGGILEHARAICAIVAPTVNSYKRLVPGYEAPIYIAWSRRNRSALIRVPEYFQGKKRAREARIEFRCPDPLCNPYLTYTLILEAGLEGIRKKTDPGEPIEKNIYHINHDERKKLGVGVLPKSLKEALEEWESDKICTTTLGKEVTEKYQEFKIQEWNEYKPHTPKDEKTVTFWEIQKYLYA